MATMRRVPGPDEDTFMAALKDLGKTNVKVGWFPTAKYDDENQTPVAYVAAINELGPNARPFMQPAADKNDAAWSAHMLAVCRQIVRGKMTVAQGLEGLGQLVRADIQQSIDDVNYPPLSLITLLARKARREGEVVTGKTIGQFASDAKLAGMWAEVQGVPDKPLQDSGHMIATVTSLVEEGNTE